MLSPCLLLSIDAPAFDGWFVAHIIWTVVLWVVIFWMVQRTVRTVFHLLARPLGLANPDFFRFFVLIPWRRAARVILVAQAWFEQTFKLGKRATAGWSGFFGRASALYKPGHVLFGRQQVLGLPLFQPIGEDCERHLAMIAGTGSGKTVQLITMLALHKGNAFVVDPKGQMFRVLESRYGRRKSGIITRKPTHEGSDPRVYALDPVGVNRPRTSACWNPLDELDEAEKRHGIDAVPRYAMKLAEGLIARNVGTQNPHFPNSARALVQALLLYVHVAIPKRERHIVTFRRLLTGGLPPQAPIETTRDQLLFEMTQRKEFGGMIARAAHTIVGSSSDSSGDVFSTAAEQTKWLDLPEIQKISTRSDFHLAELKTGNVSLFVCAPATDVRETLSGWFRLLTITALQVFEAIPGRLQYPCYFAIDEMPSLGPITAIETAAPLMRGYGVRLLCISQGVDDLKSVYPNTWRKFLGNADAVYWLGFGSADSESPGELAKILGTATHREKISDGASGGRGQYQQIERPLIYPEQLPRFLRGNNVIVTRYDQRPLRLKGVPYFRELPVTHYEPDSEYGDRALRAWTRELAEKVLPHSGDRQPEPSDTMDIEEARAVFGLNASAGLSEIEARFAQFNGISMENVEYAKAVRAAHKALLRDAATRA